MSVLSSQSIRRLCQNTNRPLISPFVERGIANGKSYGLSVCSYDCRIDHDLFLGPGQSALANTIEHFALPDNICGQVLDKSSYARRFVTAFNTHFDPGFMGWATIELVNLGDEMVVYKMGDALCQFVFHWLDEPAEAPYSGKYQNQVRRPVEAIYENNIS